MSRLTEAEGLAFRRLSMDAFTVRAVGSLRAAGVRAILLKGTSHARWLYDPAEGTRSSIDIDLLVAPADRARAEGVLAAMGMQPHRPSPTHPKLPEDHHAEFWFPTRPGQFSIDLHTRFHYVKDGDRLWDAVTAAPDVLLLGGHEIETPGEPMRALLAMLHVLRSASAQPRTVDDARRVVARLHRDSWPGVRALASQLDVLEALDVALRATEGGDAVADALALPRPDARWRLRGHRDFTESDLRMLDAVERGGVATLLRDELFPAPERMRTYYPRSRRGRPGLALAYAARLGRLAVDLKRLTRAWVRVKASARQ